MYIELEPPHSHLVQKQSKHLQKKRKARKRNQSPVNKLRLSEFASHTFLMFSPQSDTSNNCNNSNKDEHQHHCLYYSRNNSTCAVTATVTLPNTFVCVHREETMSVECIERLFSGFFNNGYYLATTQTVLNSHSPDNFAQFGNETRWTLPSVVGVFGASVDRE